MTLTGLLTSKDEKPRSNPAWSRITPRLYLHFVMYLYSAFPTSSACNESCVWEEERRCLAGGESKAAAGIKGENALGYNLIRGVGSVRRRRPICAEAGRELPSLSGR